MAQTIFAGSVTNSGRNDTPSRLSTSSQELRTILESRNLYDEFNQYPLQPTDTQRIVNSISTVYNTVAPFKSMDLENSVVARLITTPSTPLSDIGLIMLGKQFALNFQSNLAQQTFPQMNLHNVVDGDPSTKLFSLAKNYTITKKPVGGTFDQFIDRFFGVNLSTTNPFKKNADNSEYIKNTGKEQLRNLYVSLNDNFYKSDNSTLKEYGDLINQPIESSTVLIGGKLLPAGEQMSWYNFSNVYYNPYISITPYPDGDNYSNVSMRESQREVADITHEYAPTGDYIDDNLGSVIKGRNKRWDEPVDVDIKDKTYRVEANQWIDKETGFNENLENQLIWGRDGVNDYTNERLQALRGVDIQVGGDTTGSGSITAQDPKSFNIKTGLLEYTRNLLNSTRGQVVDQTRKVFKDSKNIAGFGGSALWAAPDTSLERFKGSTGLRQHSILDQYDRFAKAIRFDGNKVYGGNPDSVIYDSVLPRIHPTLDKETGILNNKNLMFSIENLAVKVMRGDSFGIMDDDFGTQIPNCEIGPFDGRIMWFPPYALEFNEVATAKFNSTVMFGRNEPIYNYMHSERSGNINFKLIIDYPPNVQQKRINEDHQKLAEFFAFGGPQVEPEIIIDNLKKKQNDNIRKIEEIKGPVKEKLPEITTPSPISISFPNDMPKTSEVNNIIDTMYINYEYEIVRGINIDGGESFGLNEDFYYVVNIEGTPNTGWESIVPAGFSQYNYEGSHSDIDDAIMTLFSDERIRKHYRIDVVGGASKLYTPGNAKDIKEENDYNEKLGQRRANSIKFYVEQRIKTLLGRTAQDLGIIITTTTVGSNRADPKNATIEAIPLEVTRAERFAEVFFNKTSEISDEKETELTPEDKQAIETLTNENTSLEAAINIQKRRGGDASCVYEERKSSDESDKDAGILKGYKSITDNYYYPAFHSQTPEDFHKRLTFLQQCTRQGAAIRSNPVTEDGITRAKNSVFGRQPICILRIGDFFYTKIIIETVTIDYTDATWDTNPEGFGMQPMVAEVTLQIKIIGGQSLKGPIDALQNAVSFNYYANSTYTDEGIYLTPSYVAAQQEAYKKGIVVDNKLKTRVDERSAESKKIIEDIEE